MTDVISPDAFNERYTLYLNTAGEPVKRCLREMTAGEVMRALNWANAEANRLELAAEPARKIAEALQQGRTDEIGHLARHEIKAAALALRQSGEALDTHAQLLSLVSAQMPQWHGSGVLLGEALRKWWRGGRRRH